MCQVSLRLSVIQFPAKNSHYSIDTGCPEVIKFWKSKFGSLNLAFVCFDFLCFILE